MRGGNAQAPLEDQALLKETYAARAEYHRTLAIEQVWIYAPRRLKEGSRPQIFVSDADYHLSALMIIILSYTFILWQTRSQNQFKRSTTEQIID